MRPLLEADPTAIEVLYTFSHYKEWRYMKRIYRYPTAPSVRLDWEHQRIPTLTLTVPDAIAREAMSGDSDINNQLLGGALRSGIDSAAVLLEAQPVQVLLIVWHFFGELPDPLVITRVIRYLNEKLRTIVPVLVEEDERGSGMLKKALLHLRWERSAEGQQFLEQMREHLRAALDRADSEITNPDVLPDEAREEYLAQLRDEALENEPTEHPDRPPEMSINVNELRGPYVYDQTEDWPFEPSMCSSYRPFVVTHSRLEHIPVGSTFYLYVPDRDIRTTSDLLLAIRLKQHFDAQFPEQQEDRADST